jgi:hypothetical protein
LVRSDEVRRLFYVHRRKLSNRSKPSNSWQDAVHFLMMPSTTREGEGAAFPPSRFRFLAWMRALTFRARLLGGLWLCFAILVALRIHGSSIALSAKWWAPQTGETHYLAQPVLKALHLSNTPWARELFMAKSQSIRSDEFAISTMWSLAQFSHQPKFPVHNTNIGNGQNMLLVSWVPVLHPASIVRPVTWGYLLFGQQMGLAWLWWFSPFFCFTTLYLALELVFSKQRRFLPVMGAFWFTASAYTMCWSNFPAYIVGFAAMGMVGAYHLLAARTLGRGFTAALIFGYATAGFVLQLYPPWMVPLAYAFAAMLVGVVIRDQTWKGLSPRQMAVTGTAAIVVAVVLMAIFILAVYPELNALAHSAYPGRRRLNGGDYTLAQLFGAVYNYHTTRVAPLNSAAFNASESSGFILFLPTVLFAVVAMARVRRRMDVVGWLLLGLGIAQVLYCRFHFPQWLADVLFWSYTQGFRSQIAIGLVSIVLSLYLLRPDPEARPLSRREWFTLAAVALATGAFYLWIGVSLQHIRKLIPRSEALGDGNIPVAVQLVSVILVVQAALLVWGKRRLSAALLTAELIFTAGNFNPLSVAFSPPDQSPLYKAIHDVVEDDRASGLDSLWLASGGPPEPLLGTVLSVMGARSLTGVQFHPQLSLWHRLDPAAVYETVYNRYGEIAYFQLPLDDERIKFTNPSDGAFNLHSSPINPLLRALGVRYIVTYAKDGQLSVPRFTRLYAGSDRPYRIWRLPYDNGEREEAAAPETQPPSP